MHARITYICIYEPICMHSRITYICMHEPILTGAQSGQIIYVIRSICHACTHNVHMHNYCAFYTAIWSNKTMYEPILTGAQSGQIVYVIGSICRFHFTCIARKLPAKTFAYTTYTFSTAKTLLVIV
jgi:hypothetical protein